MLLLMKVGTRISRAKARLAPFWRISPLVTSVVGVAVIATVGSMLLFSAHATTPAVNLEAEDGTTTSGAVVGTDVNASGGKYIKFAASTVAKTKPVFIIYYMWWDHQHWVSHLGPNYPIAQSPQPLPAALDASSCGTVNNYTGNVLTDVSQNIAYDQNNYATFLADVQQAAATGATGFAVNWVGDGTTTQSASTVTYDKRLAYMFQAVHAVNAAGTPFKLMINYQSSANILTMTQFQNDFQYIQNTYGNDSALDHTYSSKPEMVIAGTWKYTDADLATMGQTLRPNFYLIGDEKPATWDAARAANLDGTSYYWSSQDPYNNASSFTQLKNFAATVRSTTNPDGSAKTWFAPFTPGYNAMLLYNSTNCVPRNGTQTIHQLFDGNLPSNPDGWTFISWNEISEGSYIVPLTRYGTTYTDALQNVINTGQ